MRRGEAVNQIESPPVMDKNAAESAEQRIGGGGSRAGGSPGGVRERCGSGGGRGGRGGRFGIGRGFSLGGGGIFGGCGGAGGRVGGAGGRSAGCGAGE